RVHRGRDDRNRERDLARQACRGGDVVRKDVRLGGDEQNVVEGQPFAGELLVEREKALELVSCDVCLSQGTIVSAASDALSRLDADPQPELGASFPPHPRQLANPLLRGQGQAYGLELVFLDGDRVVEEDHDAVARKVLERAAVGGNQLAERLVVRTQHLEQLLRRSRLREGREAAKIAEQARDVRTVTGQQLLTVLRGDELRDLR